MSGAVSNDIVDAARRGGHPEIERLVLAAWPNAYRLAYAVLGNRQSAEDVAQESCVILYRNITSLRDVSAFRGWFYRIVVREALDDKRRRLTPELTHEPAQRIGDQTSSIDIWRALSALPQQLRDVVVLHYFEDLPSREIASILRIHDGLVRFRLMTARRRLRPLLGDAFEATSDSASEVRTHAF
jgi:RNA polymerase sigma-70 factor (ECF subfamily)